MHDIFETHNKKVYSFIFKNEHVYTRKDQKSGCTCISAGYGMNDTIYSNNGCTTK